MTDPQTVVYIVSLAGLLLAIAIAAVQWIRRKPPAEEHIEPDAARCTYCDAPAVRAPSRFTGAEGVGASLRVRFGAVQAYVPEVATDLAPSLCAAHARTWDALLAEKATTTIAKERRAAEVAIAREMAAFESETLNHLMTESLTPAQRAALKKREQERRKASEGEG